MNHKPKTVFLLDSPFTRAQWPELPSIHLDTVLELLYNTLSPIGQYRSQHVVLSRGKRSRKRQRREGKDIGASTASDISHPEISPLVLIGLNNITRNLELLSRISRSKQNRCRTMSSDTSNLDNNGGNSPHTSNFENAAPTPCHFSVIFAVTPPKSTIIYEHLPQLIATASLAHPELPATRLVLLPQSCGPRLCEALGLPRVSFIGLQEATLPRSMSLVDLVREHVPAVIVPWLEEARSCTYLPVKIKASEPSTQIRDDKKASRPTR